MRKLKRCSILLAVIAILMFAALPAFADTDDAAAAQTETTAVEETAEEDATGAKAIGAGVAIGIAAGLGALAMGIAVAKSGEAVGRQPEASGKIQGQLMLGLVFIETAIIYALIICILLVFVL